jgi:hypothetical protein
VVDGVPQLVMISMAVGGDCLPYSVSYCILASGPEGWSLMSAEHIGSTDVFVEMSTGGVVMLMWFSKSLSLPVGIGDSFSKVLISSASWNVSSFSALLQGV